MPRNDEVVAAARGLHQRLVPRPLVAHLHGSPSSRDSPLGNGDHQDLACSPQERGDSTTPTRTDQHDDLPRDACSPSTPISIEEGGQSLARGSSKPLDHGGSDGALPAVESTKSELGTLLNTGQVHPRPPSSGGATDRPQQAGGLGAETTCPTEHQQRDLQSHPLAAASEPTTWLLHDESPRPASTLRCLADDSLQEPPMESESLNPGSTVTTRYAGGLPRSEIQTAILGLRLNNDSNRCWVNATSQAWMWTTSACTELQWPDFGNFASNVGTLLASPQAGGVSLRDLGFHPQAWGDDRQQDSGEFAASLLGEAGSALFDQSWESRIWTEQGPEVLTSSQGTAPTILNLGQASDIDLQDLLDAWQMSENTVTAFTTAAACRVFHFDRTMYDNSGHSYKDSTSVWLPAEVLVPTFVMDTTYELIPYTPVALVMHRGQAGAGHFQAGLRAGPDYWVETDDGRVAGPHGGLPDAGASDMVQLWLVRSDRHGYTTLVPPPMRFTLLIGDLRDQMRDRAYKQIQTHAAFPSILRCLCVQCGQWVFTYEDHLKHMAQYHPETQLPYEDYQIMRHSLEHIPCRWCRAWDVELHQCLALWQALITRDLADSALPFDTLAPGAMAAHTRARAAPPCQDQAMMPDRPAQHLADDQTPAILPLHSTLAALATPVTDASIPDNLWQFLRDPRHSPLPPDGTSASDSSSTTEDLSWAGPPLLLRLRCWLSGLLSS